MLEKLTNRKWQINWNWWPRRLLHRQPTSEGYAMFIFPPWRFWKVHAIAAKGKWIHDPSFDRAFQIDKYPFSHWLLLATITGKEKVTVHHRHSV